MAKSMSLNSAAGLQGMLKDGHKTFEGVQGAVLRNIEAAQAIAGMVQTSLGPNGMNKLVINHLEKILVSSDCATIVKELEVQHPAAKLLVMAAEAQEAEFGDNTNFVSDVSHLSTEIYLIFCFYFVSRLFLLLVSS
jgi:T-complex protein 1 subunit theta